MKRKFIVFGILGAFVTGAVANEVIKRFAVSDLYILRGTCQKFNPSGTSITYHANLLTGLSGTQAAIISNGNTQYTLWQDASCTSQPVYFQ